MKRVLVYGMTNNRGGIETYLMNYFRLFNHDNVMFDFVTDYATIAYAAEIEQLGCKVFHIPSKKESLIRHIVSFRRILREHPEYHIVYYNILSASGVFSILGSVGRRRLIRIVHSHNNYVKRLWLHKLCRPLLNMMRIHRFACSVQAGDFMFGKAYTKRGRVTIIKNAIDCKAFQYDPKKRVAVRKRLGLSDAFVVGHVGKLCYQKNTLFLIDIFDQIIRKQDNAVLMLVGDGEDRELVESKIASLGLQEHILMLGMRSDVSDLMQAMDVFLLPSRFEGFGIVLVEAQSAGVRFVASSHLVSWFPYRIGLILRGCLF